MNRTKFNEIVSAHIEARVNNKFDDPAVNCKDDVISCLMDGKTFSAVMDQIEIRFCSVTSLIIARAVDHRTDAYRRQVRKGFKVLLSQK
jgi:hypothetical protein